MKKKILVKVDGIKNENLKDIKKVENAIETIREFARQSGNLNEEYFSVDEKELNRTGGYVMI